MRADMELKTAFYFTGLQCSAVDGGGAFRKEGAELVLHVCGSSLCGCVSFCRQVGTQR